MEACENFEIVSGLARRESGVEHNPDDRFGLELYVDVNARRSGDARSLVPKRTTRRRSGVAWLRSKKSLFLGFLSTWLSFYIERYHMAGLFQARNERRA